VAEDVSSSGGAGQGGAPRRTDVGPEGPGLPLPAPPSDGARYQPLRTIQELLDDFLGVG
jgi:hypothetical protein